MKKCKLIIKDEVNIKFEGLDMSTRKDLSKRFKYELPYARHLPSVRLGRWDGAVSFFHMGGSTYLNLLPEIFPILENYSWEIELEDQRSKIDLVFESVSETSYQHKRWPAKHPMAGQPIMLRDYQVAAINSFLENPQCLQEISTGAGKTIITAVLSKKVESYGRSIVIVPNKSLVTQTEADYINLGLDVGVYFGDRKEWNKTHTICTWQSLNNLFKKSKKPKDDDVDSSSIDSFIEGVVAVIVDEVHMAKADALKSLLTGVMASIPIRWGLTGTIPKEKLEFTSLQVSIGNVINRIAASDLQDKGVLANCHVNIIQTQETQVYKTYQSEQSFLTSDTARIDWLAKEIGDIRVSGNTLVLVDRISTGKLLESKIKDAVFVSGSTKSKDRKDQYDEVDLSEDKVIIATYGVASTGLNIIRLHNLVLLEPGKSFVRVIQSIGRGLRKGFDKDFVHIWDIASRCKFSSRHLAKRKAFYRDAKYEFTLKKIDYRI